MLAYACRVTAVRCYDPGTSSTRRISTPGGARRISLKRISWPAPPGRCQSAAGWMPSVARPRGCPPGAMGGDWQTLILIGGFGLLALAAALEVFGDDADEA